MTCLLTTELHFRETPTLGGLTKRFSLRRLYRDCLNHTTSDTMTYFVLKRVTVGICLDLRSRWDRPGHGSLGTGCMVTSTATFGFSKGVAMWEPYVSISNDTPPINKDRQERTSSGGSVSTQLTHELN